MASNQLQISNVVNISVVAQGAGAGSYNTSNLALFTNDTPGMSFGDDGYKLYVEPTEVATDFGSSSVTAKQANAVFSQKPNILAGGGYLVVIPLEASETLDDAVVRTANLVQYFGLMSNTIEIQADVLATAAVVQPLNKIAFFVQKASASIDTGGTLDLLRSGGFTQSRGLYYGSSADLDALLMQAAYAGRALSTNFSGSNTTQTMQLKDLLGVQPDPTMTQTLFTKGKTAGADMYVSFQGVPKVWSSQANLFFDRVYNLQWFTGALQIAGFNYLAETTGKVPQTQDGVDGLISAYGDVCQQGVQNGFFAPGVWNSSTTFGNQADLLANVSQIGWYIYAPPIGQQAQVDREARKAPVIQIAAKEAGAIQTSDVLVYVNP